MNGMKLPDVIVLFCLFPMTMGIQTFYMDTRCIGMNNHIVMSPYGLSTMRLRLTQQSSYRPNMNCVLFVNTDPQYRLMFHFNYLDIESSFQCNRDALTLHDGNTTTSPYVQGITGRVCGSYYNSAGYSTFSNFLTLTFSSDSSWNERGFEMIVTSFHTGYCHSGEYECSNGRCIPDDIACNGNNPCNNYSDCPLSAGTVAGIVIACLFFCVVVVTVIVLLRRRRRNRTPYENMTVTSTVTGPTPGYGTATNYPYPNQAYPQGQQYPPS